MDIHRIRVLRGSKFDQLNNRAQAGTRFESIPPQQWIEAEFDWI
jgi:hypothetical protein